VHTNVHLEIEDVLFVDSIRQLFIQQLSNLVCSTWRESVQAQMRDVFHC